MFTLQNLIKRDLKKLAANITTEQGKTLVDAEGDVMRGLQVSLSLSLRRRFSVKPRLIEIHKNFCLYLNS